MNNSLKCNKQKFCPQSTYGKYVAKFFESFGLSPALLTVEKKNTFGVEGNRRFSVSIVQGKHAELFHFPKIRLRVRYHSIFA